MNTPPDLEVLARRYVELWQDQIAAAAVDSELTEAFVQMIRVMGSGLAASTAMWQNLWAGNLARHAAPSEGVGTEGPDLHDGSARSPSSSAGPPPGAAPAAGAPPVGGLDLVQFHARLAVLEERLTAMESGSRPARRSPRRRTRRDAAS